LDLIVGKDKYSVQEANVSQLVDSATTPNSGKKRRRRRRRKKCHNIIIVATHFHLETGIGTTDGPGQEHGRHIDQLVPDSHG